MDYNKIYNSLIFKANSENRKKKMGMYYEEHHIIPKCMGGLNNKSNLVLLTAREHFLAHWILTRIYKDNVKILYAFNCFCLNQTNDKKISRLYKYAKSKHILNLKNNSEWKQKISNTFKSKIWIKNINNGKCIRISEQEFEKYNKNGYVRGRIITKRKPHSRKTRLKFKKLRKNFKWTQEIKDKIGKFFKGKSYEELYGIEKAKELKKLRSIQMTNRNIKNRQSWKLISPSGEVFIINNGLLTFFKEKNLNFCYESFRMSEKNKKPIMCGKSKGWQAFKI